MKKVLALSLFISVIFSNLMAVDAYPELIRFRQPDKKTFVSIYMKGDEKVHWAETEDGYSLITNDDGYFVYATTDNNENMIPSKYIATDINQRSDEVIEFLKNTPKKLRFSQEQVNIMLSLWQLTEEQEKLKYSGDVVGTKRILIILMGFKDKPFSVSTLFVRNMFNQVNYNFNYAKGSVRDFYYENSYGQFILESDIAGPYVADSNMAYYGNNSHGHEQEFAREAFIAASANVNFSNYDNDGDGVMDGAHILFAGSGEEAGGGADCIWSHKWNLAESLTFDSTIISTYSCSPEYQGNGEEKLTNIGVICHELGHVFGSPDYYDTDYAGSGGDFSGIGKWDLMSSGSWNGNGSCPAHHNPYTKMYIYRWATPIVLDTQTTVIVNPASEDSNSFYRINTATNGEYYLIENRQKIHFDNNLPGHGLIVYHAHKNLNYWNINTNHPQKLYTVCAATEFQQPNNTPSSYGNVNSEMCPFPGSYNRTTLSDYTTPWIRDWDTNLTNISLNYIMEYNNKIYFKMNGALPEPLSLSAEATSDSIIALKWEKYGNHKVMVRCSKNNNFSTTADSNYTAGNVLENGDTVIYVGSASKFTHTKLTPNETYYYHICSKLTDSTYTDGITTMGHTYCSPITAIPYIEEFDNGIPECWTQENIAGNSSWMSDNSALVYNTTNNDTTSSRIILTPFEFSDSVNATIKIKLNNTLSAEQSNGRLTLYYKTGNSSDWKYLQHYMANTNSEVITVLPEVSNFYLISLVAECYSANKISIDQISIETYNNADGFIIASSTDGNGTISPNGVNTYAWGDNISYTLMPNEGYEIDSLYIDGKNIAFEGNTHEFVDLLKSHTIYATFRPKVGICHPLTATKHNIAIFPNPAQDKLSIVCDSESETICYIYDMTGRTIATHILSSGKQHKISTTNLRDGVYIIKFLNNNFEKTEKLIIKR